MRKEEYFNTRIHGFCKATNLIGDKNDPQKCIGCGVEPELAGLKKSIFAPKLRAVTGKNTNQDFGFCRKIINFFILLK